MRAYLEILRLPGAAAFCAAGLLARAGGAMIGLGTVLMIRALYGQYALAGTVSAANTVCWAVGSAVIARLVDRFGQRRIMLPATALTYLALTGLVVAALVRAPGWTLHIPAGLSGLTAGAIGPLVRARWSYILTKPEQVHTAFSLESALDEATFIVGPVAATALATGVTPTAGLIVPIFLGVAGSLILFALTITEPPVKPPQPNHDGSKAARVRPAVLLPGMTPVAVACLCLGWLFGATDLTVAASADAWGAKSSTGLILAVFSLASMLAGLVYGARAWASPVWKRFAVGSVILLAAGSLMLAPSPGWLALCGFFTGVGIAPTMINANDLIRDLVPTDRLTEGLTWMTTAIGVGVSIGSTMAGLTVDHFGPRSGFVVVALVALAICLVTVCSSGVVRRAVEASRPLPLQGGLPQD